MIGAGARIDGSTVLAGAIVEPGAVITDSLVGAGARIGSRTVLAGAVVGDGAKVGADNELRDGVRIWCGAHLPAASVRFSSDE